MAECKGQVLITINGKTHHVENTELFCEGECGGESRCEVRQGRTWTEPDPADPRHPMLMSETYCSCTKEEPESCHIVLEKNLSKHTAKVHCRGGGCAKGRECRPVKVSETTDHVF